MSRGIRTALPYFVSGALLAALIWGTIGDWHRRQIHAEMHKQQTLSWRAEMARAKGVREVLLGYAFDEMEGEWVELWDFETALHRVQWVLGEPIEERTVLLDDDPDGIFTVYRIRVLERFGQERRDSRDVVERFALSIMQPKAGEILIIKSGGDVRVDGVLFKKRGPTCFSELMPRKYLLGLTPYKSGQVATLELGCRSINMVDDDGKIRTRAPEDDRVMSGMRDRFHNSLAEFRAWFQAKPH